MCQEKKEEENLSIEDCPDALIEGLEDYIKNITGSLITTTSIGDIKQTEKQQLLGNRNVKKNNCMDISMVRLHTRRHGYSLERETSREKLNLF